jgi:hypothetical protein
MQRTEIPYLVAVGGSLAGQDESAQLLILLQCWQVDFTGVYWSLGASRCLWLAEKENSVMGILYLAELGALVKKSSAVSAKVVHEPR